MLTHRLFVCGSAVSVITGFSFDRRVFSEADIKCVRPSREDVSNSKLVLHPYAFALLTLQQR